MDNKNTPVLDNLNNKDDLNNEKSTKPKKPFNPWPLQICLLIIFLSGFAFFFMRALPFPKNTLASLKATSPIFFPTIRLVVEPQNCYKTGIVYYGEATAESEATAQETDSPVYIIYEMQDGSGSILLLLDYKDYWKISKGATLTASGHVQGIEDTLRSLLEPNMNTFYGKESDKVLNNLVLVDMRSSVVNSSVRSTVIFSIAVVLVLVWMYKSKNKSKTKSGKKRK